MTSPSASSASHTLGQKSTLDYTEDYGYDPLYRLTRADRTNPGATPPNQWTWGYDAVGNRTSAQKDQEATTSTHNEKNQLLSTTGGGKMLWRGVLDEPGIATFNAASASINGQPARMLAGNVFEATLDLPAGANTVTIQAQDGSGNVSSKSYSVSVLGVPATYAYDANGNLATKTEGADAWVYTWNALNQLTVVTKNAVTQAIYKYDPLGRRLEDVAGSATTGWTYDKDEFIRQNVTSGGVTTPTLFIHGEKVDETLAQEAATTGATSYLHSDSLASVARRTNASGLTIDSLTYDAWGTLQTGVPAPFGFTGREWDAAAQMYFYRSRYYGVAEGRFVSEDSIRFNGGDNFYAYVGDAPTNYIDPFGLIRYNNPPPKTVPVSGLTLLALQCLEKCLSCQTKQPTLNLFVTGGAETSGHSANSDHYIGLAVDISYWNPVQKEDVFACAVNCGFGAGGDEPKKAHWHLQLVPGNGSRALPQGVLKPVNTCCP